MGILRSHRLIGLVFLALMAASLWFTYAIFTNKFTDYDEVTLKASKIGLQTPEDADVKYRGVIVGVVLDLQATRSGADLTLGIYPEHMKTIPADVTGSIVPKTLFGQKYVALESASGGVGEHLEAKDVITRTAVSTEVEEVLADLMPLLRAVQPEQLNYTLNALATALEGRGGKLGDGLSNLDAYLKQFNPEVEALLADVSKLAEVSEVYAGVLPEVATILRNTVSTGNTLKGREAKLQELFAETAAFSSTAQSFLAANEKNIIRLGQVAEPQLRLLAKYAPQYPCFLQGMALQEPQISQTFRGNILHINAEVLPHQPRGWDVRDLPVNGLVNTPYCGTLPRDASDQKNPWTKVPDFNDGVEVPTGKGTRRAAPGEIAPYAGTAAEAAMLRSLLSPVLGAEVEDVSDMAVLMVAPMARGAEVSLR